MPSVPPPPRAAPCWPCGPYRDTRAPQRQSRRAELAGGARLLRHERAEPCRTGHRQLVGGPACRSPGTSGFRRSPQGTAAGSPRPTHISPSALNTLGTVLWPQGGATKRGVSRRRRSLAEPPGDSSLCADGAHLPCAAGPARHIPYVFLSAWRERAIAAASKGAAGTPLQDGKGEPSGPAAQESSD